MESGENESKCTHTEKPAAINSIISPPSATLCTPSPPILPCVQLLHLASNGCPCSSAIPEVCVRRCRKVIALVAFRKTGSGFPVASSNPVKISGLAHAGKVFEMGSSSPKRPFSTHWSAATVVRSFVTDASHMTELVRSSGASSCTVVVPNARMKVSPMSVKDKGQHQSVDTSENGSRHACLETGDVMYGRTYYRASSIEQVPSTVAAPSTAPAMTRSGPGAAAALNLSITLSILSFRPLLQQGLRSPQCLVYVRVLR